MTTRILNKMRNSEVEDYLNRGRDVIFIPVGTVELHGDLPLDCETIYVEAIAEKMAEATDSLTLSGLPFFYPGATRTGRGTVYMSIAEGVAYLKHLSASLLKQGFRKQIFLSGHGPAYLTINSFIMDSFHETMIPFVHISLIQAFQIAIENGWKVNGIPFKQLMYGAYKQMNQLDYLYVDPNAEQQEDPTVIPSSKSFNSIVQRLNSLATSPGNVGYLFEQFSDHGGGEGSRSIAERDALAAEGEQLIKDFVHFFNPQQVIDDLAEVDRMTKEHILPRYPHLS
ncbi:MAG: hypothetical protein K0S04_608 [Herbinix sp.]|jgi:creatinine amidohydrolase|nr:hypothetical protein [Herbinix sp.]